MLSGDVEEVDPSVFEPESSTTSSSYISHSPLSSPSPSASSVTNFVAKQRIENVDRDQLTAACAVSSFINQKVNKKSVTPAILINGEIFLSPFMTAFKTYFYYQTQLSMSHMMKTKEPLIASD